MTSLRMSTWEANPSRAFKITMRFNTGLIAHLPKNSFYIVSVSAFIFFFRLYVKPIRSLLIQRVPAGTSFRLHFIVLLCG